jgi:hypothetical protein
MPCRTVVAVRQQSSWRRVATLACCVAGLCAASTIADAQVIAIKTMPIAEGDQFAFLPSANLGMGGAAIALNDTLLDPFINPAKGSRVRRGYVFGAPTVFSVSRNAGGGFTLPLGGIVSSASTFAGFALAIQELDPSKTQLDFGCPACLTPATAQRSASDVIPSPTDQGNGKHRNEYIVALLGRRLPRSGVSIAGSIKWSALSAVDGTDLMYPGNQGIRQSGHLLDVRTGVLKESQNGQSLEALIVHNRIDVAHDVTFTDAFWDPTLRQTVGVPRSDHDVDQTNTWGVHVAYQRPFADSGWRFGALLTGNLVSRPTIPAYGVGAVAEDAGRATALNVGVGVSKSLGPTTFGFDAIFEPISSRTWIRADAPTATRAGDTIPTGGRTIENRYGFANAIVRTGVSRELALADGRGSLVLQGGTQVRAMHYALDQWDAVQGVGRGRNQEWREWTHSWGVGLRLTGLELRYRGRLTSGTGRPVVTEQIFPPGIFTADVALRATPINGGPQPTVTPSLTDVGVTTHQISISLPIR